VHSLSVIYYVSREGVTGVREKMSGGIDAMAEKIRTRSGSPVAVGFGIADEEMAAEVAGYADAVVVGSAIVKKIEEKGRAADLVEYVSEFVSGLVKAVKR